VQDVLGQYIGFALNDVTRLMIRNFDRRAQTLGLTRAQWGVLMHLWFRDGLRQKELADLLEIKPMSLVRLLDRLEKNRWVERRNDPDDRRAKLVYLVRQDSPTFARMKEFGAMTQNEALSGLSGDEKEQLFDVLQRMRSNLSRRAASG